MFQLKPSSREKMESLLSKVVFIFLLIIGACAVMVSADRLLNAFLHPLQPLEATKGPSMAVELVSAPKADDLNVSFSRYLSGHFGTNETLTFYICFDLPEEEFWTFDDIVLKTEEREIKPMLNVLDTNDDGQNCTGISFLSNAFSSSEEVELSIGQVLTYYSKEVRDCDKAQKKLDESKTNLVIACSEWAGIHSTFEILEKPQNLSEEEARDRVNEEFLSVIQVDWRFKFLVRKL
jgi:hypothetical protein